MYKTYLYLALTLLCLPVCLCAAPRLTVVVMVDGLRQENMQRLQPFLPQGGLRLLAEEAATAVITFPHEVYGGAETAATLLSGELPASHGIAMDSCFSRNDQAVHPTLEDNDEQPISATGPLSPKAILTPVLADYFRLLYGPQSHIYAIGQTPATTLVMAGHAANGCCWLDPKTQLWGTTSFYTDGLPAVADETNISGRINRQTEREWKPRLDIALYMSPTEQEIRKKAFSCRNQQQLHRTPAVNTLTVEMALAIQEQQQLGTDDTPDLLCLQLTAQTPAAESDFILSAEQEDMYLCLNQDLGFLIEQLQKRIGKEHLSLWLTGLPKQGLSPTRLANAGLPVKTFYTDRAAALTSVYLMALHGHKQWITGAYGNAVYLNRDLIEQERMPLAEIQQQTADFLMEFEGVRLAQPLHLAYINPQLTPSLSKQTAGDIIFTLQPGWQLAFTEGQTTDHVIERQPAVPLYHLAHPQLPLNATQAQATEVMRWILNE